MTLKQVLAKEWAKPTNSPEQRWRQLRDSVRRLVDLAGGTLARGYQRKGGAAGGKGLRLTTRQRMDLERLVPGIVFTYTFPRLDVEVSKHRNHLLKAPFCIHPKTGRVCVPISVAAADSFDPTTVPTVARLNEEGTRWAKENGKGAFKAAAGAAAAADGGDEEVMDGGAPAGAGASATASSRARGEMDGMLDATSLKPYVRMFDAFVRQCEAETFKALRASNDAAAAYTNLW